MLLHYYPRNDVCMQSFKLFLMGFCVSEGSFSVLFACPCNTMSMYSTYVVILKKIVFNFVLLVKTLRLHFLSIFP